MGRLLTTHGIVVRLCKPIIICYNHNLIAQERRYGKYNDRINQKIERVVGNGGITTSLAAREHHGRDESYHRCLPADAVVMPTSVDHVSAVVRLCNEEHIPVIPFGTGTGLEGGVGAVHVSVSLNFFYKQQVFCCREEFAWICLG